MLDIGGWEFLLIVVLGIIVIGPRDLPGAVRTVMAFVRRAREMAREFQSGLEDIARETDLQRVADEVAGDISPAALGEELRQGVENTIDPHGDIRDSLRDGPGAAVPDGSGGWDGDDEGMIRAGYGDTDGADDAGTADGTADGGAGGEAAAADGAAAGAGGPEPGGPEPGGGGRT